MSNKQEKIEGLRLEALRLIDLEIRKIQEMIDKDILQAPSEPKQTFDTVSAPKTIEVLQAERHKLQNLDVVLAVVGTMKAGKSTTINAIVGAEILPNRSEPMTAIPTLIRHTKGQTQPKLVFENHQPLNNLMDNLRSRIVMPEYQEEIKSLQYSDQDLLDVVERIRSNQPISAEAIGEKAIFQFLKLVNDLVRISDRFDADFPDEKYQKINELPVIEIEFAHLKEMDSCQGRLILLDTPGPNEAGQPRLRQMLQEQLRNASAVLAVVDYTQIGSDAFEQINKELEHVSDGLSGRMYALVNKFDQHEEGKDKSKDQIFSSIEEATKGNIPAANVFAVGAKHAYLANKARQLGNNPLDLQQDAWTKEFLKATGLDEDEYDDVKRIQKKAAALWSKSGFSEPLEKIIKDSYATAVFSSLFSAVKKSSEIEESIRFFLKNTETEFLQKKEYRFSIIKRLKSDIEQLDFYELYLERFVAIEVNFFNEVKGLALEDTKKNWLDTCSDMDLSGVLDFRDQESEAKKTIKKIIDTIEERSISIRRDVDLSLKSFLKERVDFFKKNLEEHIVEKNINNNNIVNALSGFNPDFSDFKIDVKLGLSDFLESFISKEVELEVGREYYEWYTYLGRFQEMLGTNWGRKPYEKKINTFKINLGSIKIFIISCMRIFFDNIEEAAQIGFSDKFRESLQDFLLENKKILEKNKSELNKNIEDYCFHQRIDFEKIHKIEEIKNRSDVFGDFEELKICIQKM